MTNQYERVPEPLFPKALKEVGQEFFFVSRPHLITAKFKESTQRVTLFSTDHTTDPRGNNYWFFKAVGKLGQTYLLSSDDYGNVSSGISGVIKPIPEEAEWE